MKKIKNLLLIVVCTMLIFAPGYANAEENNENTTTGSEITENTPGESTEENESNSDKSEGTTENNPSDSENEEIEDKPTEDKTTGSDGEESENKPSEEEKKTIKLNKTELSLDAGKSETLIATVTPEKSEVIWTIAPKEAGSSISATIDNNGKITAGNKAETVIVTATIKGTNIKATCTVSITRTISKDATLKDLTITNGTLEPTFKSDVDKYNVIVDSDVSSLKIKYELSDSNAKYFGPSSTVNKNLKNGDILEIKVVADDGTTNKTYTLTIVKDEASLDLKKLEINGYALNEVFDPKTTEYTASIPYEIETVSVTASSEDNGATVKITGLTNLKVGENTIVITVKDASGNTKKYEIVVTREKEVSVEENATSIITSSDSNNTDNQESDSTEVPSNDNNNDNFLKYAIVSLACLILFAIGGIGIYFYLKTSPKKLKKELKSLKEEGSPILEVTGEEKNQNHKIIENVMQEDLVQTKEFNAEELENNEKTED